MNKKEKEAIQLLKKYGVNDEKIRHCIAVAKISRFIAEKLKKKRKKIDTDLVYSGALIHDIGYFNGATEKQRINHSKIGAGIAKKEGFGKYSKIVLRHDLKGWIYDSLRPVSWEEKIVNYADKRERAGVGIVSLKEREKMFLEFFGPANKWLTKAFKELSKFEKELFKILEMSPVDLKKFVRLD